MMEVSVALIIPVYNVEDYLVQCLDSVTKQIIPFDEVIIVNDGSTDHSLDICEKYISIYPYFRLICQENQGLSAARNRGLCDISSQYVMFLDSDDYLRSDTVKILKDKLRTIRYDAIFFDAEIFFDEALQVNKENTYDRSLTGLDERVMSGEEYFFICYPENYIVSVSMAVYKSQLIKEKKILFPEGRYYEDNYFTFVFLKYANMVIHISEKLHNRRYRAGSIMLSDYSEKKLSDHIHIGLLIWEEIVKNKNKLSLKAKELLLKYVSDYYNMVLDRYHFCEQSNILLGKNTNKDLESMAVRYGLMLELLQLDRLNINLILLNQILTEIYYTKVYMKKDLKVQKSLIQYIVKNQKSVYFSLLKKFPFQISGFKVGIYGTGKHTKGLLTIYEKLFGEITCDLFFIDSYKNEHYFWGRTLVNYKDINSSMNFIVLSSFLYEQDMLDNLKSVIKDITIYRFYDKLEQDIFSGYENFIQYW